jgi:hypothetical protein
LDWSSRIPEELPGSFAKEEIIYFCFSLFWIHAVGLCRGIADPTDPQAAEEIYFILFPRILSCQNPFRTLVTPFVCCACSRRWGHRRFLALQFSP